MAERLMKSVLPAAITTPAALAASASTVWADLLATFTSQIGATNVKRWLSPIKVTQDEFNSTAITLTFPTKFMRDWVEQNYGTKILDSWYQATGRLPLLHYAVDAAVKVDAPPPASAPANDATPGEELADITHLSAPLDPRFTFESFVVGKPNELAYAAALRVAEAPQPNLNPLFLYGGVGLGKTHLMHAIAWHIKRQAQTAEQPRRVLYLSAEKFMYQFIRALRQKDTMTFKEQFRSVDVLMIDDVQFICGKDNTQEEFFHTFNALIDQNKQIILSADKSPTDLEGLQDRLRSRLGWGLCADLHPTTYELRLGILQAKLEAAKVQVAVPTQVLEFLAHKITSNVRELEGALNRLVAHAELVGRPVTLESAQELLADLLRANNRRITVDDIQKKVAEHYNIKMADMTSPRRQRAVARPRQVAMYLAKTLTTRSLPEIGRKFGGRDHTTVLHAVRTIDKLAQADATLHEDIQVLERLLKS